MESLLVEEEVLQRQTRITDEKYHNFWFDRWIALQYLQYFLEARSSWRGGVAALDQNNRWKCHNFWFDRWIALQYLQYFLEARFLAPPMESLLVEEEVLSRQTGIIVEKGHNFWCDRWIALKYLQ